MKELPTYLALVDSFSKLPGIGVKSAERMAYAVLEMKEDDAAEFSEAIANAKKRVHRCPNCGLYCEEDLCDVCKDPTRDHSTCIVVSYPKDALAFEKLNDFHAAPATSNNNNANPTPVFKKPAPGNNGSHQ